MADIKAQLKGFLAELGYAKTYKKSEERISAIEAEIKALEGPARAEVDRLRTAADGHQALNQDSLATQRRGDADELEGLLPTKQDADEQDAAADKAEPDKTAKASAGKPAATDSKGN